MPLPWLPHSALPNWHSILVRRACIYRTSSYTVHFFCPISVWYWCHSMYLEDLESSIIRYWNLDRIIVEYLPYFQYFSMCKSLIDIYSQYMVNHWWTELFHSGPEWQKAHFLPLFQQKSFSLWKVGRHSSQGFNNNRERERERREGS